MLIRHALAGKREEWAGPDEARPLTGEGRAQAEALVALLRDVPVSRVLSSPTLRCVQTVKPLAAGRGLIVEVEPALAEGRAPQAVHLIERLAADDVALCTHGEIVPEVLRWLRDQGAALPHNPQWAKSSVWLLHHQRGGITHTSYLGLPG